MSGVQQIIETIYGVYEPTGAYSFEFRRPDNAHGRKIEVFLVLPPQNVSVVEPAKINVTQTIGGTFITDQGSAPKEITISGEAHFYYGQRIGNRITAANSTNPNLDAGATIGGFEDFIKLKFLFGRYRDYTMSPDGKLSAPFFAGHPAFASVTAIKREVLRLIEDGKGALSDRIDVIWHDYDYDDHFKVVVEEFSWERSKDDPGSVFYNISMVGYSVDPRRIPIAPSAPKVAKSTTLEDLRDIGTLIDNTHAPTRPETVEFEKDGTIYIIPTSPTT